MEDEIIPIIDIGPYFADPDSAPAKNVVKDVHDAFSTWGFLLLTGTRITSDQQIALAQSAKDFFSLPLSDKLALDLANGGVAWRGYMPLGGEHTHGRQDWKEGLYVGPEHTDDHPLAGMPLHGHNLFPDTILPDMRGSVMTYVDRVSELGKTLTDIISLGLGLDKDELRKRLLEPEPIQLFRCFKYISSAATAGSSSTVDWNEKESYGIGEHTDFGYLTLLKVDSPGLQVLSPSDAWYDVPVVEDSLIVNVGDMLDRLTDGRFPSRPHRVLRPGPETSPRYSFPLFFDFAWTAVMELLPLDHLPPLGEAETARAHRRWANTTFRNVGGTWSRYLARKVQKVFPHLDLPDFEQNAAPSTRFTHVVNVKT